ncbi:MAG: methionyl-tRNA formyltransferase [Betaproteobacteria bacterium]|nr:methionyl-tRNA formyltransferase [Betaproteobacteria bacterium]
MKVAFAGTPEFAAKALQALLSAGFEVPLVLTQPDRPAGRGMKLQASPVKQLALEHGLAVAQPRGLKLDGRWSQDAAQAQAALQATGAQVMVVAAYGLILPAWVLHTPPHGCLNIHASLLPRWRGAAPIHRAVQAGDPRSGVTIMQMDEGLDTGPVLLMEPVDLAPQETTASLHDKLADVGGRLMVEALELLACGGLQPRLQAEEGVCYAHKIEKAEAPLDWSQPALSLERRIRAFDPFPGATARFGDEVLKVWKAQARPGPSSNAVAAQPVMPGTVLAVQPDGVEVACGQGSLMLLELQRAGGRRQPASTVAQSLHWAAGVCLQ